MIFKHFIYCFVCLMCLSAVAPLQADERGAEIIERLQKKFDGLKTLSARFTRQYYWQIMDQKSEIKGHLYVERPKRFRFETQTQTVVTNGEMTWNYAPKNEQVLISDYSATQNDRSPEKLLFDLILLGGYAESYSPAYIGEKKIDNKDCRVVELTAKLEDTYIHRIRLWIDKRQWVVRQVEYRDLHENLTTYELSDLEIGKQINEETFQFRIPKNVEVVDLR